jgi:type I restriction enzyme R subunit
MWLTGFDAPSLHTMYLDKPMSGHGLMQAIARVNRVFRDKPGGLVVDYLGIADELRKALAAYTESGGTGKAAIDQAEAVALRLEKHEICAGRFHGFDRRAWVTGDAEERLALLPAVQEHILAQEDGKARLLQAVTELSAAFALAVPADEAIAIRDDVGFYQAVRAALAKSVAGERKTDEHLDHAIRQIVSQAIVSDEVIDIFAAAGLKKPDISILSDEFLAEVRGLPQRNVAVELLRKLLAGEITSRARPTIASCLRLRELQSMVSSSRWLRRDGERLRTCRSGWLAGGRLRGGASSGWPPLVTRVASESRFIVSRKDSVKLWRSPWAESVGSAARARESRAGADGRIRCPRLQRGPDRC